MIILISGKQGSGKTTLAQQLKASLGAKRVLHMKFADPLYQIHNAMWNILESYGIPREEKSGDFLQFVGTEWGRKRDPEIWVKIARTRAMRALGDFEFVIIDDCRFENEFDAFPEAFSIRLECDREIRKARAQGWREDETHPSEVGLDGYSTQNKFNLYLMTDSSAIESVVKVATKRVINEYNERCSS